MRPIRFFRKVSDLLQNFVRLEVDLADSDPSVLGKVGKSKGPRLVTLIGKPAIEWKLGEVGRNLKNPDMVVPSKDFKVLDVFGWLLNKEQLAHRDRFLRTQLQFKATTHLALPGLPLTKGVEAASSSGASCSSATSASALAVFAKTGVAKVASVAPNTKEDKKKGLKEVDEGQKLLSAFFRA